MKYYIILFAVLISIANIASGQNSTPYYNEHETFPHRGFCVQSEFTAEHASFYAGGTIDSKIAYLDISFGGSLDREDISARIEYGMNLFKFSEDNHIIFIGIGGIVGSNIDRDKNGYDWFFTAPFFTAGYKFYYKNYGIAFGVSKQYGWNQKYYKGDKVFSGKDDEFRFYVKFNLFAK